MRDMDWRKRYAPDGYAYVKRRIEFVTLDFARFPAGVIQATVEEMQAKLANESPYFYDPSSAHTCVSVYPKDVGENLNHLDSLKPRFGIEIEIRQPTSRLVASWQASTTKAEG